MRSLITKVAIFAASFAVPAIAHADAFTFTTATGSIQFHLPNSPTSLTPGPVAFQIDNVPYTYNSNLGSGSSVGTFFFFSNGNFAYQDSAFHTFLYATSTGHGPVFSGSPMAPTFNYSTYNFTYDFDFGNSPGPSATLTDTPEPSSLALMGTGFFGVFAVGRRRLAR